ncbi:MAG: hypothetical protein D4R84_03830 [Rhodocyclaceae bacterium]|nr:MAG: hypothetical protein D4R84_03830 [Rhodocyclaceae bacterium]
MAAELAEYVSMDAPVELVESERQTRETRRRDWSRRAAWAVGLLAVVMVTALAFGAYRQPELLLNLLGLRYCG